MALTGSYQPGEKTDSDVVNIHSVSSSQKGRCVSLPFLGWFPVLLFISQWKDKCCGSVMLIPDPDFLSISDPTTAPKDEGGKKFSPTIFCSRKYHNIVYNFIFEQVKKNFSAKTLRIV